MQEMTATPPKDAFAYCAAQARRGDYDRYLCLATAPDSDRPALFALLAFNDEIAKTRAVVSEPLLGQIRLQWWRESLDGIYADTPRDHPVVRALASAVSTYALPRAPFDRMVDARETDLTDEAPPTLEALEAYVADTAGALAEIALAVLDAGSDADRRAGHHAGMAWGLTGLLRALPHHAASRRRYLPDDIMAEAEARASDYAELRDTDALAQAIGQVARRAESQMREARGLRREVSPAALSTLLPLRLAEIYLRKMRRRNYRVMRHPVDFAPLRKQWRVLRGAMSGRY